MKAAIREAAALLLADGATDPSLETVRQGGLPLPHLSLEPVHQRGWGSSYAALARGSIDTERLRWSDPAACRALEWNLWSRCLQR